jgi:hypothetical protein
VITYTFRVSYPRPMTLAESEAIAAAMVATARRLAEAAPPAVSAAPPEPTDDTPPDPPLSDDAPAEPTPPPDVKALYPALFEPVPALRGLTYYDDAPPPPSAARVHLIGTLIAVVLLALLWLWFSIPALATLPALWGGR